MKETPNPPLNTQILQQFSDDWNYLDVSAKNVLLRPGQQPDTLLYVDKGILRVCVDSHDGKSFNKTFVIEGMFYADLYHFWTNTPTNYMIETLEACKIRTVPLALVEQYTNNNAAFQRLFLTYMKSRYIRHEQREISLQTLSAKERYIEFKQLVGPMENRIAAYHIASYLGMTEVNLSRIKRELSSTELTTSPS
ncbi:Uncharacterised protein [BD1-7 clade bacterium]|uniref:Cyclic nucleotide-binding domain-containing protein n=1 Tax=BD1-7 clade bacterium TaxID=2029982 RepID=A0A5S9Q7R1_9GAMM|nr:Uncharacterised protein [BD1-7 clade bacterium]